MTKSTRPIPLKGASEMDSGTVGSILPDRGDRYPSTNLFRSHCGNCHPDP